MALIYASPTHTPPTRPIVEIPRTPEYYTHEELKEEMNKLKATQIGAAINFEDKMRDTIMYLIDRVEWSTFYIELSKFVEIIKNLKENEAIVRTILARWIQWEQELSILCTKLVGLPFVLKRFLTLCSLV